MKMKKRLIPVDADSWQSDLSDRITQIIYDFTKKSKGLQSATIGLTSIKIMVEIQKTLDSLPED